LLTQANRQIGNAELERVYTHAIVPVLELEKRVRRRLALIESG
jgi:hypothetical protein